MAKYFTSAKIAEVSEYIRGARARANFRDYIAPEIAAGQFDAQATVAKVAITYTANDPTITTDEAITIADGSAPTVAELLEFCEELNDQMALVVAALDAAGITA